MFYKLEASEIKIVLDWLTYVTHERDLDHDERELANRLRTFMGEETVSLDNE